MIVRIHVIIAGLIFSSMLTTQGFAQAPGSTLAAGYAANADKPINIEADSLEVNDQKKTATFSGNVTATQGDFTLKAKELQVNYVAKDKKDTKSDAAGPGSDSQIKQINAKGKVLVKTKDNQTATSDWARFDVPGQLVTIGGNVVLTEGLNTIKGDRLVIELKTGISRFENSTKTANGKKSKRLQAIFSPKSRSTPEN